MKETLPERGRSALDLNPFNGPLIDPQAWPAAVRALAVALAFGVYLTITPDFRGPLGVRLQRVLQYHHRGQLHFHALHSREDERPLRAHSDDVGGNFVVGLGHVPARSRRDQDVATIGGLVYGASIGINMPTVFAWTSGLAQPGRIAWLWAPCSWPLKSASDGGLCSGMHFQGDVAPITGIVLHGRRRRSFDRFRTDSAPVEGKEVLNSEFIKNGTFDKLRFQEGARGQWKCSLTT